MASFPREDNRVPVIGGVSSADFATPTTIGVDPTSHAVLTKMTAVTTGSLSKFHLVVGASTNGTNVKASAGQVYTITGFNTNAAPRYLKFHDTAGTPTAGVGVTDTYMVPGNANGAGFVIDITNGMPFTTGIGITTTTGIADNDTGAVGSSDFVINIYYV